jgi:large subunit ribosomal protein L17
VQSLVISEKIQTTETKAKAIKGLVDKIINNAKSKDSSYLVNEFFNNKQISEKLIKDLAPRLKGRNSGYTSTVKLGRRSGDSAMVVQMSLLLEEAKTATTQSAAKKEPSEKVAKVKPVKEAKPARKAAKKS